MAAPRLLPDRTTLERLRRNNVTYKEIADMYGVTEAAVYMRLRDEGLVTGRKVSHKELIPWSVKKEHQHAHPALMLRTLSRRRQGLPNLPQRDSMLDRWLDDLEAKDAVVMYDPEMPPVAGIPQGGWWYAKRRKSDGDSIIRYSKPGKGIPPEYR